MITPAVAHILGPLPETGFIESKLPPAFGDLKLHNRSTRSAESPTIVSGTVPQWGYLASARRTSRAASKGVEAVQIRIRVLEGHVGVGLLNSSGSAFLDASDGIEAGTTSTVTFLAQEMDGVGSLVFRSTSDQKATFEWMGADNFQLKPLDELVGDQLCADETTPVPGWNRYYTRFAATPMEAARRLFFDQLHEPSVMKWRSGLQVVITPGEETSGALFVSGSYEPGSMIALERFIFPGAVLFDIGANVGLYTLIASRHVGRSGHVYSFEPSSREQRVLQQNLALNECSNVTIIAAAVTDKPGTGTLRIAAGQHRGQNTLAQSFSHEGVQLEGDEPVELVSLDALWAAKTVRRPDVVKIDAEGSELHLLRGAVVLLRDAQPVIIFEINDALLQARGASRAAVEDCLTSLGYSLYRIDDRTAALVPIPSLSGVESENFVALPSKHSR